VAPHFYEKKDIDEVQNRKVPKQVGASSLVGKEGQ
jgi:hypothetical protein